MKDDIEPLLIMKMTKNWNIAGNKKNKNSGKHPLLVAHFAIHTLYFVYYDGLTTLTSGYMNCLLTFGARLQLHDRSAKLLNIYIQGRARLVVDKSQFFPHFLN